MNQEKLAALPTDFGAPFEGGFYGGVIAFRDTRRFAVVWAPKDGGDIEGPWLDSYTRVDGAMSCCDSMANTRAMAEAGSPIAKAALAATIGGHSDWCIPARDVLELAYRHLKPGTEETGGYFRDGDNPSSIPAGYPYAQDGLPQQTAAEGFQAGQPEAFEEAWYWSSTQYSEGHAWSQYFTNGFQGDYYKEFEARARLVRLIQIDA